MFKRKKNEKRIETQFLLFELADDTFVTEKLFEFLDFCEKLGYHKVNYVSYPVFSGLKTKFELQNGG